MTCPICRRGDDVEHGRVLCQWRRYRNAWSVRATWEIEQQAHAPEPCADRLRLAWWVVRHEHRLPGDSVRSFAWRATAKAAFAARLEPGDEFDRAQRDIDRYAADRWALAALEAI